MGRLHISPKSKSFRSSVDASHIDDVTGLVPKGRPLLQLPQPYWKGMWYRYITGEALEQLLSCPSFYLGQNVWVCKSKGAKKSCQAELSASPKAPSQHRHELFLRAIVMDIPEDKDRVRVKYPQGSTYLVQPQFLIPILDASYIRNSVATSLKCDASESEAMVLVYPETAQYRRACTVHTAPSEHFVEIGCAEGITCHRVYERSQYPTRSQDRIVLGIDKSSFSIQVAQTKYATSPNLHFVTFDILQSKEEVDSIVTEKNTIIHNILHQLRRRDPTDPPSEHRAMVVAVDINGNRDLDPVLQCIQILMERLTPRLIIVKSRSLHNALACSEIPSPL